MAALMLDSAPYNRWLVFALGLVLPLSVVAPVVCSFAADEVSESPISATDREHWSFRAVARPEVPRASGAAWCRNEIDRFILAALEKKGLAPLPEADRATLIRRLS